MQYREKFRISDTDFQRWRKKKKSINANSALKHFIGPKHSPCLALEQGIAEFMHLKIKPGELIALEVINTKS